MGRLIDEGNAEVERSEWERRLAEARAKGGSIAEALELANLRRLGILPPRAPAPVTAQAPAAASGAGSSWWNPARAFFEGMIGLGGGDQRREGSGAPPASTSTGGRGDATLLGGLASFGEGLLGLDVRRLADASPDARWDFARGAAAGALDALSAAAADFATPRMPSSPAPVALTGGGGGGGFGRAAGFNPSNGVIARLLGGGAGLAYR